MLKDVLTAVKTALQGVSGLRYAGEDWGQIDYFRQSPVKFPCALVDVETVDYSDNGPRYQQGVGSLTVRVADSRMFNGSFQSPPSEHEFEVFDLLQSVYKALQGLSGDTFSPLTRTKLIRARRDDSIREFRLSFDFAFTDPDAGRRR